MIGIGVLSTYCLQLLTKIVDDTKMSNILLGGLAKKIYGETMQKLINICIVSI